MPKAWLLVATLLALTGSPAAARNPAPVLTLAGKTPVVVHGAHFIPRETIRIVVAPAAGAPIRIRADRAGTFTVRLPGVQLSRCGGFQVRATGTHGTIAMLKLPRPACMPARKP